jgi:hypothetical protein
MLIQRKSEPTFEIHLRILRNILNIRPVELALPSSINTDTRLSSLTFATGKITAMLLT